MLGMRRIFDLIRAHCSLFLWKAINTALRRAQEMLLYCVLGED